MSSANKSAPGFNLEWKAKSIRTDIGEPPVAFLADYAMSPAGEIVITKLVKVDTSSAKKTPTGYDPARDMSSPNYNPTYDAACRDREYFELHGRYPSGPSTGGLRYVRKTAPSAGAIKWDPAWDEPSRDPTSPSYIKIEPLSDEKLLDVQEKIALLLRLVDVNQVTMKQIFDRLRVQYGWEFVQDYKSTITALVGREMAMYPASPDRAVAAAAAAVPVAAPSLVERKAPRVPVPAVGGPGWKAAHKERIRRVIVHDVCHTHAMRAAVAAAAAAPIASGGGAADVKVGGDFAPVPGGAPAYYMAVLERVMTAAAAAPAAAPVSGGGGGGGGPSDTRLTPLSLARYPRGVYIRTWQVLKPKIPAEPLRGPPETARSTTHGLPIMEVLTPEVYDLTKHGLIMAGLKWSASTSVKWSPLAADLLPPLRSGLRWSAIRAEGTTGQFQWAQTGVANGLVYFYDGEIQNPPLGADGWVYLIPSL